MQKSYPLNWRVLGTAGAVVLAILVLFSVAGGGQTVSAQTNTGIGPVNSISVSGSGDATGTPDVAYINLGVDTVDADVGKAVENANTEIAAVIAAITDTGIDPKDVQTTNFNVYPEDKYDQNGQATGERVYHVQNLLNVTVRDISKVSTVIDAGLGAGADSINGLNFGIADTTALEQEARLKAVEDARTRAGQLADAFGVTLGDPIIVSEVTGGSFQPPIPFAAQAGLGGGGGPQINPGQLQVNVQVTVTFAIGS
jgi:uncharacterized protein YggE